MNIKEYEKIIKELEEKDIGTITKLYILNEMIGYEKYQNLSDNNKEKLLDYIYTYYMENDLYEHYFSDIVELILNSGWYGYCEILDKLDNLDYKTFENIINEKI